MSPSIESSVVSLDFNNVAELWFTEITLYICVILIWYLLIKMSWFFCISPSSPRLKQYDTKALKPIKAKAEQARIRRESQSVQTTTSTKPQQSVTSRHSRTQNGSTTLKPPSDPNASYSEKSPEEFKLQICKIHRSLRLCFIASLVFTSIYITVVMLNHTLIISGAIARSCIAGKLPVTFMFLQRLSLYLFFIFRLHYSFGATQFGVKSVYLWVLIVCIVLCGIAASFYFFLKLVTAPDSCASDLAFSAGFPGVAQDYFFNIFISVLFLTRLRSVVKSQHRGSTRNLEKAKLKKARSMYKYYYTMYKLTVLFLTALFVTVTAFIIMYLTDLAAAMTSIDSVMSNYFLFLNFQFNDDYFRIVFCGCLRLQSLILGKDYANEMELHFYHGTSKPAHKQSSKTWQDKESVTTNTMGKIEEEVDVKDGKTNNVSVSSDDDSGTSDKRKESSQSEDTVTQKLPEIEIKIDTVSMNDNKDNKRNMKLMNVNSKDSDVSANTPQQADTPYDDTPLVDRNEEQ